MVTEVVGVAVRRGQEVELLLRGVDFTQSLHVQSHVSGQQLHFTAARCACWTEEKKKKKKKINDG